MPNAFDRFTMTRKFRARNISNPEVLWQLELACWLRWIHVVAGVAFMALLITKIIRDSAL